MKPENHLHFMGIGGVGMRGLAKWFKAEGYEVSGCDLSDSEVLTDLRAKGIEVHVGHGPEHLDGVTQLVRSMAVPVSASEVQAAVKKGLHTRLRMDLLAELFELRKAVAVTGTHGKSTTTGMLATIFLDHAQDPSVLLGAVLLNLDGTMRYGQGPYLVVEVDESDPGFANLNSEIAIITNLEDDHIAGDFDERRNYHASLGDLERAAQTFASRAEQVVYCCDWAGLDQLFRDLPQAYTYGTNHHADYRIEDLHLVEGASSFGLVTPAGKRFECSLQVPGAYNVQNATAALIAAQLAGIPLEQAVDSLKGFTGVGRRWQRWGELKGALIIDDYAHHPTEVEVTLQAAKHTGRRVRAVLQPHRWVRTARHWPALADAASLADEILVLDVYGAGEQAIPGVSAELIVERLLANGSLASHHDIPSAEAYLGGSLEPGDLIITLGAGDVWRVAAGLVKHAEGQHG